MFHFENGADTQNLTFIFVCVRHGCLIRVSVQGAELVSVQAAEVVSVQDVELV